MTIRTGVIAICWSLMAVLPLQAMARPSLTTTEVATQIDSLRREHGVAAASLVLVDRDGVLLHQTWGLRDRASGLPADGSTRFRIGSITKTFTTLALLRAESQGLLKLDEPIKKSLPKAAFQNRWEATSPLTLAMLMEHSSGWPEMSLAEFDSSDPKPLSVDEALAIRQASRISRWPPGQRQDYSSSGPGLAAWVLEQRSGQSFEHYLQQAVFAPLAMPSASVLLDADTRASLAQGYDRDGATPIPYWHVLYRAAAGLNLNPRDMAPMIRMLLNQGRVDGQVFLTPTQVERMQQRRTVSSGRYGLGLEQSEREGHRLFGHSGDADGYLARFDYCPESGRGYFFVITAFQSETSGAMRELLQDWLVQNLPPALTPRGK